MTQAVAREPQPAGGRAVPLGRVGRYLVFDELASGGTASVHLGRLEGAKGFARVVALKRLHPHIARDPEAAGMLRDEAWLSARVRHPNVVAVLDVVEDAGELLLVMEYVEGISLFRLVRTVAERGERIPLPIVGAIVSATLAALEAAHGATAEDGSALGLIHRDVSPQNVLVGFDGVVRLADFGVAKARGRIQTTHEGELKGKFAYMAPEQALGKGITERTNLYATGVVLWECLTGRRLHEENEPAAILTNIIYGDTPVLRDARPDLGEEVASVVTKSLAKEEGARFETARAMAEAVDSALGTASPREVAAFVTSVLGNLAASVRATRERVERAVIAEEIPALPSAEPTLARRAAPPSDDPTLTRPAPSSDDPTLARPAPSSDDPTLARPAPSSDDPTLARPAPTVRFPSTTSAPASTAPASTAAPAPRRSPLVLPAVALALVALASAGGFEIARRARDRGLAPPPVVAETTPLVVAGTTAEPAPPANPEPPVTTTVAESAPPAVPTDTPSASAPARKRRRRAPEGGASPPATAAPAASSSTLPPELRGIPRLRD